MHRWDKHLWVTPNRSGPFWPVHGVHPFPVFPLMCLVSHSLYAHPFLWCRTGSAFTIAPKLSLVTIISGPSRKGLNLGHLTATGNQTGFSLTAAVESTLDGLEGPAMKEAGQCHCHSMNR